MQPELTKVMKTLKTVYSIVSYILIVVAGLLGLFDLIALLVSLANPVQLLSTLILAGVVIYSFTSFIFCLKAVQNGRYCKPSLHLWIRATAIITVIFALQALIGSVTLVTHQASMNEYYNEVVKMQRQMMKTQPSATGTVLNRDSFLSLFTTMLYIVEFYSMLLLLHVTITFRLLKQYSYLFGKKNKDEQPL